MVNYGELQKTIVDYIQPKKNIATHSRLWLTSLGLSSLTNTIVEYRQPYLMIVNYGIL